MPIHSSLRLLYLFLLIPLILAGCDFTEEGPPPAIPGKLLVSIKDQSGDTQLYIMRTDGSQKRQLIPSGFSPGDPRWTPDGQRVVFMSTKLARHTPAIWAVDATGINPQPIRTHGGEGILRGSEPVWSPDGTKIAFSRCTLCQGGGNYDLFIYDLVADSVMQITRSLNDEHRPSWSPDNKRILFNQYYFNVDEDRWLLRVMMYDTTTGEVEGVPLPDASALYPSWSPAGDAFVYLVGSGTTARTGNLALKKFGFSSTHLITTDRKTGPVRWSKNGEFLLMNRIRREGRKEVTVIELLNLKGEVLEVGEFGVKFNDFDWYEN